MLKNKSLLLVILASLMVSCVSASEHEQLQKTLTDLKVEATSQATYYEKEIINLEEALSKANEEITDKTNELHSLNEELETMNDEFEVLQREKDSAIKSAERERDRAIEEIEAKYICEEGLLRVDYESNYTVGQSLIKFVSEGWPDEPVTGNYWKVFWTGEKHSLHTVEVRSEKDNMIYVWEFVVYFKGESHGSHPNGVFWTGEGCWLEYEE